ncbi:hypothetical protein AB751O23_BY_00020 [Chlamydiales bacterium SCGC AB-751-O23]|jgi:uncharacterized protein|nr:hypothetical protein AB751O23_BY_00020 [Chlamydiales bacterium SCGC AB-751-O23]
MTKEWFSSHATIDASLESSFQWHQRIGTFERLFPPWANASFQTLTPPVANRNEFEFGFSCLGRHETWKGKYLDVQENHSFSDMQVKGPFYFWLHKNSFSSAPSKNKTIITNQIEFELPYGNLGKHLFSPSVKQQLRALADYRHKILQRDIPLFQRNLPLKKILITGSHGFLGMHLKNFLLSQGHEVHSLKHIFNGKSANSKSWSYLNTSLPHELLEGYDVVIHLAAENLINSQWTRSKKEEIYQSRVMGTKLISQTLSELNSPPELFMCASGVGYYGNTPHLVTEDAPKGKGFLSDVNSDGEKACEAALKKGIRTTMLRFGHILSPDGGVLKKLLPYFSWGLGAKIASGEQAISWIALDDALHACSHLIHNKSLEGPINFVSPFSISQRKFAKALASTLKRPQMLQIPSCLIKLLFKEMGEHLLLNSQEVSPQKLLQSNFKFQHDNLSKLLPLYLGKPYNKPQ